MNYIITGRNLQVTEPIRNYIEKKFKKLSIYFREETDFHVTLSSQKGHMKVEATIPMKGTTIRAEEIQEDLYTAIDKLEEILERQLRRNRKKLIAKNHDAVSLSDLFYEEEQPQEEEEDEIRIVKTKHFALKPMSPEEACFQMELSSHNFYVFRNGDTNEVNVVYKRKDGDFGLIEPDESED